jgi:ABC-type molybdenum transport system, ATPase component/photorepair protein PhrA
MSTVASLQSVGVTRNGRELLSDITWIIDSQDRWVILGPNGAGKTTLLTLLASLMHPTTGELMVLDEQVGKTDVFELRPRVGFASSAMAKRLPRSETVRDAVLTAAQAVTGRWREEYDDIDICAQNGFSESGISVTSPIALSAPCPTVSLNACRLPGR